MNGERFDQATVLRLLDGAVRAPSADNQHHFRFVVRPDGLDVLVDDDFRGCEEAHRRLLTLLSYGAATENLRLRLTELGWTFLPRWFPEGPAGRLLLALRWDDLDAVETADPLAAHIATRHTNRRLFDRRPIAADRLAVLTSAAVRQPDVTLDWFGAGPERRALLRTIAVAEAARFHMPDPACRTLRLDQTSTPNWQRGAAEKLAPATLEVDAVPERAAFERAASSGRHAHRPQASVRIICYGVRAGMLPNRHRAATRRASSRPSRPMPPRSPSAWRSSACGWRPIMPRDWHSSRWSIGDPRTGPTTEPLRDRLRARLRRAWEPLVGSRRRRWWSSGSGMPASRPRCPARRPVDALPGRIGSERVVAERTTCDGHAHATCRTRPVGSPHFNVNGSLARPLSLKNSRMSSRSAR